MKLKKTANAITLSIVATALLGGCASTPKSEPKMVGMWAERFEGNKSLEVWARIGANGQQEAIVLFIEPKNDGSGEFEAICGAGAYKPITIQNGRFAYEQDRINATVQRIRNNKVRVSVNSGCIPSEEYTLQPINQRNSDISAEDSLKY